MILNIYCFCATFFSSVCELCTNLYVSSNLLQPEYEGRYVQLPEQIAGRPAYRHTTCQLYLYFIPFEGGGAWVFSPQPGSKTLRNFRCIIV